ncbi:hypothetical protein KQH23_06040, partial [Streptomyces sp. CHB19.2]|nr:hypothetical protein [Streptomyces sp. CHB19.2]
MTTPPPNPHTAGPHPDASPPRSCRASSPHHLPTPALPRWPSALLLVAALGLANFALLRGAGQGWTSAATLLQSA